jgi:hypothetical protein
MAQECATVDPISIVSILCSLGCCLFSLLAIVAGLLVLLRSSMSGSAVSASTTAARDRSADKVEDKKTSTVQSGGLGEDFEHGDFEEEMATVVAPPPPGLGRRAPVAPPPPPPPPMSSPGPVPIVPPSSPPSMPEPRPTRSSGQTIIAFDDDFDDDDDDDDE